MQLRENQIEPVQKGIEFFKKKSAVPSLIVMPTAAGKSWVIAKIAESIDEPVLILQPSRELLKQNVEKFCAIGGTCTVYSASFNQKEISHVTYATIGSIKNDGAKFYAYGFKKVIIDEAHLYPRKSSSMLNQFLTDAKINGHVLGLTATPLKLQTLAFGSKLVMLTSKTKTKRFFHEIIHVCQVKEMIDANYWSKLKYYLFDTKDGKLKFNSTGAEYTEESLKNFYYDNNIEQKIIQSANRLMKIGRTSVLIFVPSVKEAHNLSAQIPNSAVVSAQTPDKERNYIIEQFKAKKIFAVVNVNVLSVGFDFPELDNIICGRRTASFAWYYQALGRLTRIHPNKQEGWIIDYSGNVKRFGKIEELIYRQEKQTWKLYGEGGRLITGIYLQELGQHTVETEALNMLNKDFKQVNPEKEIEINKWAKQNDKKHEGQETMPYGKYQGYKIKDIPVSYQEWMIKNWEWSSRNQWIKDKILKIAEEKSKLDFDQPKQSLEEIQAYIRAQVGYKEPVRK
jgi:DNA repair protein RadD